MKRLRIEIEGAVQGVGFRPFVYRLARNLRLAGWVVNDVRGVVIEVEGDPAALERFLERLEAETPPASRVERQAVTALTTTEGSGFEIRSSPRGGARTAQMLPDLATCDACLRELFDRDDRRHRYPFINCTHCGPRLSIINSLPYDRPHTTMKSFEMCRDCRREYEDPADRRFHAQPDACSDCGPTVELRDRNGCTVVSGNDAVLRAARAIRDGEIVAVKSLGGFHLMCDATDGAAIERLRKSKPRREKPLALMARDLEQAGTLCRIDDRAATLLRSSEAPIVLLARRPDAPVDPGVAPDNPTLGVMLAATPLHHLLMHELDSPVVATSGNLADEPLCIDNDDALRRLAGIASAFLVHDRPIARQVDDSVVRILAGRTAMLRRARGYAPRPVPLASTPPCLLAVGAQLKNAVAVNAGKRVFVSQHIGDMETPEAIEAFERIVRDYLEMYAMRPEAIVHDLHPDYFTTRWAQQRGNDKHPTLEDLPRIAVQHHHAHLASCLADNAADGPALGVIWDGTGYGTDGTIWGGEFLIGDATGFRRAGHLRTFRLPGGDTAIREPRRAAAGLLWELDGPAGLDRDLNAPRSFTREERAVLERMLERGINSPLTSSAGRLFDGIAALAGLQLRSSFEGQAAMALEFAVDAAIRDTYPVDLDTADDGTIVVDWRPLLMAALGDVERRAGPGTIAARFHNALVDTIVRVAQQVGQETVALSGGCFQNAVLLERTQDRLTDAGHRVLVHRRFPPNDGGISLGQIAVAAATLETLESAP